MKPVARAGAALALVVAIAGGLAACSMAKTGSPARSSPGSQPTPLASQLPAGKDVPLNMTAGSSAVYELSASRGGSLNLDLAGGDVSLSLRDDVNQVNLRRDLSGTASASISLAAPAARVYELRLSSRRGADLTLNFEEQAEAPPSSPAAAATVVSVQASSSSSASAAPVASQVVQPSPPPPTPAPPPPTPAPPQASSPPPAPPSPPAQSPIVGGSFPVGVSVPLNLGAGGAASYSISCPTGGTLALRLTSGDVALSLQDSSRHVSISHQFSGSASSTMSLPAAAGGAYSLQVRSATGGVLTLSFSPASEPSQGTSVSSTSTSVQTSGSVTSQGHSSSVHTSNVSSVTVRS